MVVQDQLTFAGQDVTLAAERWTPSTDDRRLGTVLLLHGGGQTRNSWKRTAERLAEHGWTAIALDARGHGDSSWASDADYTPDAMIADLRAVVAALGERPVLVGASLGGITSLLAQGEDPALASGLVLVDVTPRIQAEGRDEVAAFMRSGSEGFGSLEEAAEAVTAFNPSRKRPPRPEGMRKNLRLRDGRWYWHWDPKFLDTRLDDLTPEVIDARTRRAMDAGANLKVPTMLVRASNSQIVSPESAQELLAVIPHGRLVNIDGASHMVAGDDNDLFARELLGFLGECARVGG
ncbi:alpha/beta hydrolase [Rhodococcus pseudokoreensis]|uniref:Alpha/beta hydrolase n=1 Tax=Rhodococcus pseudokoreensis TaxID=2811421 RepID=A0A974ZUH3_9NOCA|nr:alpha/beta hydrolase [Rhodococcus pseudokoreensis]QSE90789.1 alpha/beta hydrolase [Rhodococcus pseudokoreensis]